MATREEIKIKESVSYLSKKDYQVLKPNELRCSCCGKNRSVWESKNWFMSWSPVHKGNTAQYKYKDNQNNTQYRQQAFAPICRKCIDDVYLKNAEVENVINCLRLLDKPFIKATWIAVYEKEKHRMKPSSIFGTYVSNISLNHKELTFSDSEDYLEDEDTIDIETEVTITSKRKRAKYQKFWGTRYDDRELIYLQDVYDDYVRIYPSDTPTQINGYKHVAKTFLMAENAIDEGNTKQYKDMMELSSKLHNDLNIKPIQSSGVNDTSKESFGQFVEMVEKTEPITNKWKAFEDVDGIRKYIQKWFVEHFEKIFGLRAEDDDSEIKGAGDKNG